MSAATIDRLLKPCRQPGLRRPFSTTKPGSLLKGAILVRTFAEWEEKRPGFLEIDLVAHCGREHRGILFDHAECGGRGHRMGGVPWGVRQGTGAGWRRHPTHRPAPALSAVGVGLGQRWRVHQPAAL